MSEAAALKPKPLRSEQTAQQSGQIFDFEAYQAKKLKSVAGDVGEALGKKVSVQSIQPAQDHPVPIHVPSGESVDTSHADGVPIVNGSYGEFKTPLSAFGRLAEPLAFADRVVRGEHDVKDEAHRFTEHKKQKEEKRLHHLNNPTPRSEGPVEKFVDWMHTPFGKKKVA